jgi:hypothetical protein
MAVAVPCNPAEQRVPTSGILAIARCILRFHEQCKDFLTLEAYRYL